MSKTSSAITMKNELPEVIDLFSGCGGLALGFVEAGFPVAFGADIDAPSVETASFNLDWRYGHESQHVCADVRQIDGEDLLKKIGQEGCIVIGGPPCQAYSNIGIAKLRSLGEERKHTNDARGTLYQDFLRVAFGTKARAIIMENVPDATSYGDLNIPETVAEAMAENGYDAYWTILNAADFGVPQVRERIFVLGIREDEKGRIALPVPTHSSGRDDGVTQGSRVRPSDEWKHFRKAIDADESLPDWVTVGNAFEDLPSLFPEVSSRYVLYRMNAMLPYKSEAMVPYQNLMRTWYGVPEIGVTANGIRKTTRDYPIFGAMQQGDDFVAASRIADELLEKAYRAARIDPEADPKAAGKIRNRIVPPYDRENFKTKWQRLRADTPSHTVTAHLSVDTYSHIHPWEPRGISVREAARLQSFPDGFAFQCSMGDAFRQIGNAVPPMLAKAIAERVREALQA